MSDTEKTLESRLAWLAGIIDADGWVGFYVRQRPWRLTGRRRRQWTGEKYVGTVYHGHAVYRVGLDNTSPALVAEVAAIADILGAKFNCRHDGPRA